MIHAENCAPEYNEHGVPVCRCDPDNDRGLRSANASGAVVFPHDPAYVVSRMLEIADDLVAIGISGDTINAYRFVIDTVAKESGTEIEQ